MSKPFPSMCSKPEKITIFGLIPCWIWVFILLPLFMPFLGLGIWEQWEVSSWLEIGYHAANGILMFLLIHNYLKEEWFMAKLDIGSTLKHVALTLGLMIGAELVLLGTLWLFRFPIEDIQEFLPVVEMTITHTPWSLLSYNPIFGTIAVTVFVPFTVCALFYCCCFAPICYKKTWLAYVAIAVATLIPSIIDILWRGEARFMLCAYIARLPIHLLSCWSYQKTDNVWTPILSLAAVNLLISLVQILVF